MIIVGAGLSGLAAARAVLDAGREPLVLEADDRVGGRILTENVDGIPLELGAQWIGDTHHRMEALAAELGVGIYDQFEDGETTYEFGGEVLRGRRIPSRPRPRARRSGAGAAGDRSNGRHRAGRGAVDGAAGRRVGPDHRRPVVRHPGPRSRRPGAARDLHGRHPGDADGRGVPAVPAAERRRLRSDRRAACRVRRRCADEAIRRRYVPDPAAARRHPRRPDRAERAGADHRSCARSGDGRRVVEDSSRPAARSSSRWRRRWPAGSCTTPRFRRSATS